MDFNDNKIKKLWDDIKSKPVKQSIDDIGNYVEKLIIMLQGLAGYNDRSLSKTAVSERCFSSGFLKEIEQYFKNMEEEICNQGFYDPIEGGIFAKPLTSDAEGVCEKGIIENARYLKLLANMAIQLSDRDSAYKAQQTTKWILNSLQLKYGALAEVDIKDKAYYQIVEPEQAYTSKELAIIRIIQPNKGAAFFSTSAFLFTSKGRQLISDETNIHIKEVPIVIETLLAKLKLSRLKFSSQCSNQEPEKQQYIGAESSSLLLESLYHMSDALKDEAILLQAEKLKRTIKDNLWDPDKEILMQEQSYNRVYRNKRDSEPKEASLNTYAFLAKAIICSLQLNLNKEANEDEDWKWLELVTDIIIQKTKSILEKGTKPSEGKLSRDLNKPQLLDYEPINNSVLEVLIFRRQLEKQSSSALECDKLIKKIMNSMQPVASSDENIRYRYLQALDINDRSCAIWILNGKPYDIFQWMDKIPNHNLLLKKMVFTLSQSVTAFDLHKNYPVGSAASAYYNYKEKKIKHFAEASDISSYLRD